MNFKRFSDRVRANFNADEAAAYQALSERYELGAQMESHPLNNTSVLPGTTTWGDGHGDRRSHVIDDIAYRGDQNWIICRCGTMLIGLTPERLAVEWQSHGGVVLEMAEFAERSAPVFETPAETRAREAVALIVEIHSRCTCTEGSDIMDCPNYLPGDEAPDAFEEDPETWPHN